MKDKLTKNERLALAGTLKQSRDILKKERIKNVRPGVTRKQSGVEFSLRGSSSDDVFLAKSALDKHNYPSPLRPK
jgi:hypothetical protein